MKCGHYVYDRLPDHTSGLNQLVAIHFHPGLIQQLYRNEVPHFLRQERKGDRMTTMLKLESCQFIDHFMKGLMPYFHYPEMVDDEWVRLKLKEFMHLIAKTSYGNEIREMMGYLFSPTENSFREVVERHIFSDLSTEELAQLSNCSIATFNRRFKQIYRESPGRYVRNRRLDFASELLLATDREVSAIAYECQFKSLSHFSTAFRNRFRCSPSEFRQSRLMEV